MLSFLAALVLTATAGLALNRWAERRLLRPDARYPHPALTAAAPHARRLVCAGDSLTHANMSASYLTPLAARLAAQPAIEIFNAGINADLAENLRRRLDDVLGARPDFVTVLIGSNDVNASLGPAQLRDYRRLGKLTADAAPSAEEFQVHLTDIVRRLRRETSARVALLSLPPLSEDLSHEANRRADLYSRIIEETAAAEGAAYLPLREHLLAELRRHPSRPRVRFEQTTWLVRQAIVRHYVFGQSWDRIAAGHGCRFLTDNLHLNAAGAAVAANLIADWLATETQ